MLPSNRRYALSNIPDSCVRRKTGTATNSRLWNWLAVPGLPTADTPPVARPIFVPPDEVLPHNGMLTLQNPAALPASTPSYPSPNAPSPSSPWAPRLSPAHPPPRADDRHVCVTKSLAISATQSNTRTYPRTSNTLDFRILRHNSPSRRRPRLVPGRHAHQPHRKLLRARYPHRPRSGLREIGGIAQAAGIRAPAPVLSEHHVTLVAPELYAPPIASP